MKKLSSLLLLLASFLFIQKIQAQDFIKLEGKVLAADTKEPIPFASIGIPEKGIGNICNEAGAFELKIPVADKNAKVCLTALGFKELCLSVSTFKAQNHTVFLEPANLQLATVEIKAISAESLVKEAIRRIPENYAAQPVLYTFYQRELRIENDQPAFIIESVNEALKKHPKNDFQASILKTRGKATSKETQEKLNEKWVGVNSIQSYVNIARYQPFLQASKYKQYNFQFEKEDLIGKDTVYVITFKPKLKSNGQEIPGSEGRLFLHYRSKAIIRLEAKENQAALDKENNHFLIQAANKVENGVIEFQKGYKVIEYKQDGNRWYFNNVYSETYSRFTPNDKRPRERSHFIQQLVVTNVQTENAQEIPEEKRAKRYANLYSAAPKDMNEAFWQEYNVIPLPAAYQNKLTQ